MENTNRLTNEMAYTLLSMKKIFVEKPGKPLRLQINEKNGKQEIRLQSEDGIEEFSLHINRSSKRIAKVTFHYMERNFNHCLFRLDINGAPHTNPREANEYVPDYLKKYKGVSLGRTHVHYYVEGYGLELSWALPLKETKFSGCNLRDIEESFQKIIDTVCEVINLDERIIYDRLLSYGQ